MELTPHVRTPESDEVLRRIGRNVVNFQFVEHLLKRLTALSVPPGPASKTADRVAKHAEALNTSTMGILAGRLKDTILTPQPERSPPDNIEEIWIGFQFSMEVEADFVDRHDKEMQALVDARNDLIHHFLPRWHATVNGDVSSALAYLDAQHAQSTQMMERLAGWVESMDECRRQHAELFASPEFDRQFDLMHLRSSRLVARLGEIAQVTARTDGWAYLTTAANLIRRAEPDELEGLDAKYGLPNLKAVLLSTEYFDVAVEPLSNGGSRTIYRIGDRYELTIVRGTPIDTK